MQMVNVAHAQHLKAPGVRQLNLEDIAMNKSSAPTSLEKRVVTVLTGNGNLPSAAELQELISDTELSVQSNLAGAEAARVESLDLVQCRDPSEANQRIATAKLTADRLSTSLPKLHDKLSEALAAEQCDRWWNDYKHVKEKLDAAVEAHKEYPNLVQAITKRIGIQQRPLTKRTGLTATRRSVSLRFTRTAVEQQESDILRVACGCRLLGGDSVAKVVLQEMQNFRGPLARYSCNDLRDLIALRQIRGRLR
jgi:hypothetical protein